MILTDTSFTKLIKTLLCQCMRIANEREQEHVDSLIFRVHHGERSGLVRSDVVIPRKSEEREIMHR